jgi:hypothetical protein
MSRTWKDSKQENVIEVIKRENGAFDLLLNRKSEHEDIQQEDLAYVLCVRFGYCADEFNAILLELNRGGRIERRY